MYSRLWTFLWKALGLTLRPIESCLTPAWALHSQFLCGRNAAKRLIWVGKRKKLVPNQWSRNSNSQSQSTNPAHFTNPVQQPPNPNTSTTLLHRHHFPSRCKRQVCQWFWSDRAYPIHHVPRFLEDLLRLSHLLCGLDFATEVKGLRIRYKQLKFMQKVSQTCQLIHTGRDLFVSCPFTTSIPRVYSAALMTPNTDTTPLDSHPWRESMSCKVMISFTAFWAELSSPPKTRFWTLQQPNPRNIVISL